MARKPSEIKTRRDRQPDLAKIAGAPTFDPRTGTLKRNDALAPRPPQPPARNFSVIERQTELKRAGYGIKVDGVWGPRAQTAWTDYMRKRRTNPLVLGQGPLRKPDAADVVQFSVAPVRQDMNGITPAQIAQRQREARERARAVRKRQDAQARARILENAALLRRHPGAASQLNLRQFTAVVVDPETKFNIYQGPGRRAAFQWLDSHGYRPRNDSPREIHRLFERALNRQRDQEVANQFQSVRKHVYRRLGIVGGSRPSWWRHPGPIPTSRELARLIFSQDSGERFHGSRMLNDMLNHGLTGQAAYSSVRHSQLLGLARKLQPFGQTRLGEFLKDPQVNSMLGILQDIYSAEDLMGFGDYSDLVGRTEFGKDLYTEVLDQRAKNEEIVERNFKAVNSLRAEVRAMLRSSSEEEYNKRLVFYLAVEEAKFTRFQKEYASHSLPWWGQGIEKLLSAGRFGRTALVYDAMRTAQGISWILGGRDEWERNVEWEDAMRTLGAPLEEVGGEEYDGLSTPAHRASRITFELFAEPLNFAHPFRVASTIAAVKGAQMGSYRLAGGIADAARLSERTAASVEAKMFNKDFWSSALVYQRGTWSKMNLLPEGAARHIAEKRKQKAFSRSLLLTRDEAIVGAKERVTEMTRHGFRQVAGKKLDFDIKIPSSKKTREMLEQYRPQLHQAMRDHPEWGPLIDESLANNVSLYVDKSRRFYSNFGASLLANIAEKARVSAGHSFGVERGWEAYRVATQQHEDLLNLAEQIKAEADDLPPMTDERRADVLAEAEQIANVAEKAAYQVYLDTLQGIGLYLEGGAADPFLMKEALRRTFARMDDMEQALMPAMQDMIEEQADALFEAAKKAPAATDGAATKAEHAIWDEEDLWRGRHGEEADMLRALGRESFKAPVRVKNWQRELGEMSWDEANELIDAEIRRRLPRAYQYAARSIAAGTMPKGHDVSEAVNVIKREVYDAWQRNPETGKWADTRPELLVSDLYARNQVPLEGVQQLFRRGRTDPLFDPVDRVFAGLAESPRFAADGPLDAALWRISWSLGSRFRKLPGNMETLRRDSGASQVIADARTRNDWDDIEEKLLLRDQADDRVRTNLEQYKLALARAYDEALPNQLAKDGALMRAWAEANNRFLEYSYRGLMSIVNGWVFATLPLRPGWGVRNVIDNTVKLLIQGVHDPRYYFLGGANPGKNVGSVFDMGLYEMGELIRFMDGLTGKDAYSHWLSIRDSIWQHSADTLGRIFKAHGVEVNERLIQGATMDPFLEGRAARSGAPEYDARVLYADAMRRGDEEAAARFEQEALAAEAREQARRVLAGGDEIPIGDRKHALRVLGDEESYWQRFRDGVWNLMGARPENAFRRILYRHAYESFEARARASGEFVKTRQVTKERTAYVDVEIPDEAARHEYLAEMLRQSWMDETAVRNPVTGRPAIVHHGTPYAFDAFDPAKQIDPDQLLYGRGIYTTEDPSLASTYAQVLDDLFADSPEKVREFFHSMDDARAYVRDEGLKPGEYEIQDLRPDFDDPAIDAAGIGPGYDANLGEFAVVRPYRHSAANVKLQYLDLRNPVDVDQSFESHGIERKHLLAAMRKHRAMLRDPDRIGPTLTIEQEDEGFSYRIEQIADHFFPREEEGYTVEQYAQLLRQSEQSASDDVVAGVRGIFGDAAVPGHVLKDAFDALNEKERLLNRLEFLRGRVSEQGLVLDGSQMDGFRRRIEAAELELEAIEEQLMESSFLAAEGFARPVREMFHGDPTFSFGYAHIPHDFATSVLQELGFDGITHMGGRVMGGRAHRVWIAWDPDQVKHGLALPTEPALPGMLKTQKRVVEPYTETVTELDETALAVAAHDAAWRKVEETLFDYSKITVAEDNFRLFFPFIQFWRKNTVFWAKQFADKPWLPVAILHLDQQRKDANADLPDWMRRYIHVDQLVDAAAFIPGLDKVVSALLPDNVMYDPFNVMSFTPFYRAFKKAAYGESDLLPGEEDGWPVIGPMIDAINDFGLGMSPFVRKPLESAGVASTRAWQSMYPQTNMVSALTRSFISEQLGDQFNDWERVFTLMQGDKSSEQIAENFTYLVQAEVAGQIARGEDPSVARAEKIIRAWFLTQNVWGYFSGFYLRRGTESDIHLSRLLDDAIKEKIKPTDRELELLKLWGMRGMDRLTWERYIALRPVIEQYYETPGWEGKQAILTETPELTRWVDAAYRGRPFSGKWLKYSQRFVDTEQFMQALQIIEHVDPPYDVRDAAVSMFKDPSLERYWKRNDSPQQIRDRMVKAQAFEYYQDLNRSYHAIPDDDYEAKSGFIAAHPELVRYWNRNNDPADDLEAIITASNAAAREAYFALVNSGKGENWDAAAPLLKLMPFMFEDTKSQGKIDEATGTWKVGGGGKDWSPERQRAWIKAQPHIKWFFETYMPKVGKKKAWDWLETAESDVAKTIKAYLKKYGKHSQRGIDYMRAKPFLKLFFDMPSDKAEKWLKGDSEGAKIVRWYFEKYGTKGNTQHARDYLKVKTLLDRYFDMPKPERRAWLNGGSAEAERVRDYFKKYSKTHQWERAWRKANPTLANGTPEQKKRLEFWNTYFNLTPEKRPAFILANAEKAGVFLYGDLGETERHDQEQEWMRRAVGLSNKNKRQQDYLYAKPLLDFYFDLPKEERDFFARLNPEVAEYLAKWSSHALTGNKELNRKIEQYFKLPSESAARTAYLREHPDVQDYFDSKSAPAVAAMRNVLEQYFALPYGRERDEFVQKHPEVQAYFDERQAEKARMTEVYRAFDQADPRLRPYMEDARDLVRSAEELRYRTRKLAMESLGDGSISSRRTRATTR